MNTYDHEDAFKDANYCAAKYTNLGDAIKLCGNKEVAALIIKELQDRYLHLFDAFIEGVDYGRRHPKEME